MISRFLSEVLLSWLIEKDVELVWETDTPYNAPMQWAMLCAKVLMCSNAAAGRGRLPCTFTCSGVPTVRAGHGTGTGPRTSGCESGVFIWNGGGRLRRDGRRPWYSSV